MDVQHRSIVICLLMELCEKLYKVARDSPVASCLGKAHTSS